MEALVIDFVVALRRTSMWWIRFASSGKATDVVVDDVLPIASSGMALVALLVDSVLPVAPTGMAFVAFLVNGLLPIASSSTSINFRSTLIVGRILYIPSS